MKLYDQILTLKFDDFNREPQNTIMTDTNRNFQGNRQFYLRGQLMKMDKQLTIIRDKAYYNLNDNQT